MMIMMVMMMMMMMMMMDVLRSRGQMLKSCIFQMQQNMMKMMKEFGKMENMGGMTVDGIALDGQERLMPAKAEYGQPLSGITFVEARANHLWRRKAFIKRKPFFAVARSSSSRSSISRRSFGKMSAHTKHKTPTKKCSKKTPT